MTKQEKMRRASLTVADFSESYAKENAICKTKEEKQENELKHKIATAHFLKKQNLTQQELHIVCENAKHIVLERFRQKWGLQPFTEEVN